VGAVSEFGSPWHLATRFFGALSPAGPAATEEAWALDQLLPGEIVLWRQMSGPDRRHGVGVAREVARLLDDGGPPPTRAVLAGALLHDVGKVQSGLGTFARVGVTLAALALGRDRLTDDGPRGRRRAQVRDYLTHDRLGGQLLRGAGSDSFTVSWAEQHHRDPTRWTVDARLGRALKAADGD
jgi:hypothetical protein